MKDKDILGLVDQESFLNYCFKRNDKDVLYWKNWLLENPERRQQVENLKQMLILMGEQSRQHIQEKNFAKLQVKIDQTKSSMKSKTHPLWRRWSIAAAVSFLMIGIGSYFYTKTRPEADIAAVHDVSPGGNKAVLILGNGQKVDLTYAANGAIADQAGIKVRKTADGQIIYDISNTSNNAPSSGYNTIETPVGGQYQINLSDGTKVWLNSASTLRYPIKFAGKERKVTLTGEGYFEVAHHKAMPFKVSSLRQTVEVLGTHFNIMAYADERAVKTTLLEGSVNVQHEYGVTRLVPGQQAQLSKDKIHVVDDVDMEDAVAWKDGYFKFNESLGNIMTKISRWYGVEVIYQMKPDPGLTYTGKISRTRNISAVLKMIEYNGDVHFKVSGKKVYVTK